MSLMSSSPKLDRAGLVASIGCAVHCAATPFVVVLLPFGGGLLAGESSLLHTLFTMLTVLIGGVSARIGLSFHNSRLPSFLVLLGGTLIVTGGLVLSDAVWSETVLVVAGACLIASAHAANLYLCRCRACHAVKPILAIARR